MYHKAVKPQLNLSLKYFSNSLKSRSFTNASPLKFFKENLPSTPRYIISLPTIPTLGNGQNIGIIRSSVLFSTNLNSFTDINNGHGLNCNCSVVPNENEILNQDSELRSILDDIMKDFDATPSSPPGSKAKIVNDSVELNNDKVGSDDVISSNHLSENGKTTDGKINSQGSSNGSHSSGNAISLDDLINLLQGENLKDICVIKVPEQLAYSDYLVLVTALSVRQLRAVAENVCKIYKSKNQYFQVEGKDSNDWKVIDMGSIVLHFFTSDVREYYDLESLWTVGEQFDELSNEQQSDLSSLLEKHTNSFSKLKLAFNNH